MNNWLNRNSSGRTALDQEFITIKFKTVYPDFTTWKDSLVFYGVDVANITETDYNVLSGMIGNAYMKFTTADKVKTYTAFKFRQYWKIRVKEMKLFNLDLDQIMLTESSNEQAVYTIGRRLDTGIIEADYLDNKVVSKIMSKDPIIDKMNAIKEYNKMQDPELLFLIRIANTILLPLQPNQKGETY